MKVLLDTVVLYRAALMPDALSSNARAVLEDESHAVFVSIASAWELSIKASLGKLALPSPIDEFFPQVSRDLLAHVLPIELKALARVATLPLHHGDPFDRLIIAQALAEECIVLTSDKQFTPYGVRVVW